LARTDLISAFVLRFAYQVAPAIPDYSKKIPKPSKLDDLVGDPDRRNAVVFLVTTELDKAKTVRVNITARENQIELIDRLAGRAGMTRSAYMVQSATAGVADRKRDGSRRRIGAHAKQVKTRRAKTK
jgi:hypothetical protein